MQEQQEKVVPQRQNPLAQEKRECEIAVEPLHRVINAVAALSTRHYDEIGMDNSIPYNPDLTELLKYAAADKSILVTARYDSVLVGYILFLLGPYKHSKGVEYADLEAIWISPAFRSGMTAIKMLKLGEEEIRKTDAVFITGSSTVKRPIDILFKRLDYMPVETVFFKRLDK